MGLTFRGSLKQAAAGSVAVVQMKDAGNGLLDSNQGLARIKGEAVAARYLLKAGDLVFRSRGFDNSFSLVTARLGIAITIAPMMFVRIHDPVQTLPDFLHWWLNRPATQKLIAERAQGGTIHMIPAGALADLPVEVPPIAQQRSIANIARLSLTERNLALKIADKRRSLVDAQLHSAALKRGGSYAY
jgi:hypothetical protein